MGKKKKAAVYQYVGPEYKTGIVIRNVQLKDPENMDPADISATLERYPFLLSIVWIVGGEEIPAAESAEDDNKE